MILVEKLGFASSEKNQNLLANFSNSRLVWKNKLVVLLKCYIEIEGENSPLMNFKISAKLIEFKGN